MDHPPAASLSRSHELVCEVLTPLCDRPSDYTYLTLYHAIRFGAVQTNRLKFQQVFPHFSCYSIKFFYGSYFNLLSLKEVARSESLSRAMNHSSQGVACDKLKVTYCHFQQQVQR